jgi:hypothetical protein
MKFDYSVKSVHSGTELQIYSKINQNHYKCLNLD